jgi:hypothetical protein
VSDQPRAEAIEHEQIRRRGAEQIEQAIEHARWWDSLADDERHAISCYAPQFGRKCSHGK